MSDTMGRAPSAREATRPDDAPGRTDSDQGDVAGHSLRRGEDAIRREGAELGEGHSRRYAIPDDGDDVEGHGMVRGEGAIARRDADLGDGVTRRIGPGEGHASRT